MRIGKFLASLGVPLLAKNDLVESIDVTQQDISALLPALEDAAEFLSNGMKSVAGKNWEKAYNNARPQIFRSGRKPWIVDARVFMQNTETLLTRLRDKVEKEFGKDVAINGIDYERATILQLIAVAAFCADYTRRRLAFLVAAEGNVEARTLPQGKEKPVWEQNWLESNQNLYFRAMDALAIPAAELTKALDKIPEIRFDPDKEEEVNVAAGSTTLDPLSMNFVDVGAVNIYTWNPFYIWGMFRTSYKLHKIDRMRSDIKAIQLRLEQLRLQAKGTSDAALEARIEFYEDEVNTLAEKMAKLEKKK